MAALCSTKYPLRLPRYPLCFLFTANLEVPRSCIKGTTSLLFFTRACGAEHVLRVSVLTAGNAFTVYMHVWYGRIRMMHFDFDNKEDPHSRISTFSTIIRIAAAPPRCSRCLPLLAFKIAPLRFSQYHEQTLELEDELHFSLRLTRPSTISFHISISFINPVRLR